MKINSEQPPTGVPSPSGHGEAQSPQHHRERSLREAIERLHAISPDDDDDGRRALAQRLREEISTELNALLLEQLGLGGHADGHRSGPDFSASPSQD
jgi:hypothetical protein